MTVLSLSDFNLSPEIIIDRDEHRRLTVLALAGSDHSSEESDWLLYELERARLVPPGDLPDDVVRMGSRVRFRTNAGQSRAVVLVYPNNADISADRISIMTPIGVALIGLRTGQSITWLTRDGRKQVLTVLGVTQPDDGGCEPPNAA
jgi:regulator of nucleoside diphosphate kinase